MTISALSSEDTSQPAQYSQAEATPSSVESIYGQRKPGLKSVRVLKLGGSSVADTAAVAHAISSVHAHQKDGQISMVVVSALAGVTETLIALLRGTMSRAALSQLRQTHRSHFEYLTGLSETTYAGLDPLFDLLERLLQRYPNRQWPTLEQVRFLATGERLAARVITAAFQTAGARVRGVDAATLLSAQGSTLDAAPDLASSRERFNLWWNESRDPEIDVWVMPGFFAQGMDGGLALFGRGGSDTSATLLGAVLGSALDPNGVEIWTDVEGVYPVDPRRDPSVLPFARLDYGQAEDLALAGAKVLHAKAIHPARQAGIPILVRHSRRPWRNGTRIDGNLASSMNSERISP